MHLFYYYFCYFVFAPNSRQIWKAELLLSDFILHKASCSSELHGVIALELGAGTGMLLIIFPLFVISSYLLQSIPFSKQHYKTSKF